MHLLSGKPEVLPQLVSSDPETRPAVDIGNSTRNRAQATTHQTTRLQSQPNRIANSAPLQTLKLGCVTESPLVCAALCAHGASRQFLPARLKKSRQPQKYWFLLSVNQLSIDSAIAHVSTTWLTALHNSLATASSSGRH